MNKWLKYALEWSAIAAIVVAVLIFQTRGMLKTETDVPLGQLVFQSLEGQPVILESNDKPWVLYFFAPWCTICSLSIENINSVDAADYNRLIVALDYASVKDVEAFLSRHSLEADVVLGNTQHQRQFKISGYPSYYILDSAFVVKAKHRGYSSTVGLALHTMMAEQ